MSSKSGLKISTHDNIIKISNFSRRGLHLLDLTRAAPLDTASGAATPWATALDPPPPPL